MSTFEHILQLIKENAATAIQNNPSVPADKKESAVQTIAKTIQSSLKGQVESAGLGILTNLFNSNHTVPAALTGNSIVQQITDQVAVNLFTKLGIDHGTAVNIASAVIPLVMSKIIHRTNDPSDQSFTFDSLIGKIAGGNAGTLMDDLKSLF